MRVIHQIRPTTAKIVRVVTLVQTLRPTEPINMQLGATRANLWRRSSSRRRSDTRCVLVSVGTHNLELALGRTWLRNNPTRPR